MKLKKILALVCALALVFSLTACISAGALVGTWEGENGSGYTFDKDGTGKVNIKIGNTTSSYDIKWALDGEVLTISTTVTILGFSSTTDSKYNASIEKGVLTLKSTEANSETGEYEVEGTLTKKK